MGTSYKDLLQCSKNQNVLHNHNTMSSELIHQLLFEHADCIKYEPEDSMETPSSPHLCTKPGNIHY